MIVPAILRHLRHHINNRDDILDKSLEALGSILIMLHNHDPVSVVRVALLAPSCPPPGPQVFDIGYYRLACRIHVYMHV